MEENELLSILGPNGVGKAPFFAVYWFASRYEGEITLHNRDIRKMGIREMAKHVAYIPQSHYTPFNYTSSRWCLWELQCRYPLFQTREKTSRALRLLEQSASDRNTGYTQISGGEGSWC